MEQTDKVSSNSNFYLDAVAKQVEKEEAERAAAEAAALEKEGQNTPDDAQEPMPTQKQQSTQTQKQQSDVQTQKQQSDVQTQDVKEDN